MSVRVRTVMAAFTVALSSALALAPAANAEQPLSASRPAEARSAAPCSYSGSHPVLTFGSSGSAVAHAQCLLRNVWDYNITVDGQFGIATHQAVMNFQTLCAPPVDGIIGSKTWNQLHPDTSTC